MEKEVMQKVKSSLIKNNNIPFDLKDQIGELLELLEIIFEGLVTNEVIEKLETLNIKALSKYYTTEDMLYDEMENSISMSKNIDDGKNALMRALVASLFCKGYDAKYKALAIGINRQIVNCVLGDSSTEEFMFASLVSKFIDDDRINEENGINHVLDGFLRGNLPLIEAKMIDKGLTLAECDEIFSSANSTYYTLQSYRLDDEHDKKRCDNILANNRKQIYNVFKTAELRSNRTDEEKQEFLILLDTWNSTISKTDDINNIKQNDLEPTKKR